MLKISIVVSGDYRAGQAEAGAVIFPERQAMRARDRALRESHQRVCETLPKISVGDTHSVSETLPTISVADTHSMAVT